MEPPEGEFTKEELVALGEAEEEPESSESEEVEGETAEEEEAEEKPVEEEKAGEEEKEKAVPYDRFSKVYGEKKTLGEKLDLLKRDPEAYFELYPEEKPKPEEEAPSVKTSSFEDYGSMVVQGGKYDGNTLNEVYEQSPADANALLFDYKETQREEQRTKQEQERKLREESETEINTFSARIAKELFEKESVDDLDDIQAKKVENIIIQTMDWMQKTGRGGGFIEDAYFLMHKDEIVGNAAIRGADGLIKQLSQGSVRTVKGSKSEGTKTGFAVYESMTPDQLQTTIEGMDEKAYTHFLKNAPSSLRQKYPDVDWM